MSPSPIQLVTYAPTYELTLWPKLKPGRIKMPSKYIVSVDGHFQPKTLPLGSTLHAFSNVLQEFFFGAYILNFKSALQRNKRLGPHVRHLFNSPRPPKDRGSQPILIRPAQRIQPAGRTPSPPLRWGRASQSECKLGDC